MNRAERRRQLKEDEKLLVKGIDAASLDASQPVALMRLLREKLKQCIDSGSVTNLMHYLFSNLTTGARFIADVPTACTKGCSHCCHIWVDATAPEIFYAIKSLPNHEAAAANVDLARQLTEGTSFYERGEIVTPCPLLADNHCSIYANRPINCRTAVSADAGICKRSYLHLSGEDIPMPAVWMAHRSGYAIALRGALNHAGLVSTAYEWNEALSFALANPNAEKRWLAGEDVFAGFPTSPDALQGDRMFQVLYHKAFG